MLPRSPPPLLRESAIEPAPRSSPVAALEPMLCLPPQRPTDLPAPMEYQMRGWPKCTQIFR